MARVIEKCCGDITIKIYKTVPSPTAGPLVIAYFA